MYTLTEEEPLPVSFFRLDGPKHTFSPVADGRAPTFAQVILLPKICCVSQSIAVTLWWLCAMFLTIEFAHVITSLMTECLPTGCGLMIILGDSIVFVLKQTYALERIFCGNS